jgi:hypothetical protein
MSPSLQCASSCRREPHGLIRYILENDSPCGEAVQPSDRTHVSALAVIDAQVSTLPACSPFWTGYSLCL